MVILAIAIYKMVEWSFASGNSLSFGEYAELQESTFIDCSQYCIALNDRELMQPRHMSVYLLFDPLPLPEIVT